MSRRFAPLLLLVACAHGPPRPVQDGVVFTQPSPLARPDEIARRALTPLTFRRTEQALEASGQTLREQPVDVAREKFTLYLPAGAPPKEGYGLLVFISPTPEPARPETWRGSLDRRGIIFVSPAGAANGESVFDRRLPLALLAADNVRARYPVDPQRTYVGGWSGGSLVAELTALAYPDVFRGALLHAGSERIGGEGGMHLPPAELFRKLQQTRLVYVTGERDEANLVADEVSRGSMKEFCVLDVAVIVARRLGHEWLDAGSMERALAALDQRATPGAGELERCNERLQRELDAALAEAEAALARGDRDAARAKLQAIDGRYAGLAARAILDLDAHIR
jgi:pimeloyl-ACP methyl ester carboxylesterase